MTLDVQSAIVINQPVSEVSRYAANPGGQCTQPRRGRVEERTRARPGRTLLAAIPERADMLAARSTVSGDNSGSGHLLKWSV
jgi:hypothetical protein